MKRVYLLINATNIRIYLLRKRGDFFVGEHKREAPLGASNPLHLNPSKLYSFITNFLHDHKLSRARAIVSYPHLTSLDDLTRKLATFQISLYLGKANLTIEKLLSQDLFA